METKKILLILFVFFLTSCAKPLVKLPEPLKSISQNKTAENKTQELEISPRKDTAQKEEKREPQKEALPSPEYPRRLTQKPLPPPPPPSPPQEKKPIDTKALVGVTGPVLLNVESMPLSDFIVYALGDLLKVVFLIDEDVRKMTTPVTLRMPKPLPPEEVLSVVIDYLEKKDLTVEQKGKVLSITKPKPKAPPPPPKVQEIVVSDEALNTSAQVAQFVPLKYLRPFDIEPLLRDLVKTSVEIKRYDREAAFLFIGPGYQIKELIEVLKILDVPSLANKKLYLVKLTYWQVEEFEKELSRILGTLGFPVSKNIKDPGVLLIPIKSLNSLLCAFPDETSYSYALEWIKRLDSPDSAGAEIRYYIYRPLYSKAVDLADSLRRLLTGEALKTVAPSPQPQPGARTPQATQPQTTSFSAQGMSISADEKRNLLLITATPPQYQAVLQVLKELDRPPRQVLIEATILELTLKDELKLGLEWYLKNKGFIGNFTPGRLLSFGGQTGFTYHYVTDSGKFDLLINLFASKGLTNILSTPRVLVLDNQAATIQVGTDIPVITGEVTTAQAVTGATAGVVRSIQYRSTGVILSVKPTIYTEGLLQLEITQEVSEMGASPPGIASPTVLVRKINTNVVAGDGETLVLGGLISTTKGKEEIKIPLLGDIPLFGNLFKTRSEEERKTELIVLLRPYIIKNLEDARAITQELKERLKWLKE